MKRLCGQYNLNFCTLVFFLLCLSGCGAVNYHLQVGKESAARIQTTRVEYEKRFIGESKEIVLGELGKPYYVQKDAPHSGKIYPEEWVYKIERTFWEGNIPQAIGLYFDGDKVYAVSAW